MTTNKFQLILKNKVPSLQTTSCQEVAHLAKQASEYYINIFITNSPEKANSENILKIIINQLNLAESVPQTLHYELAHRIMACFRQLFMKHLFSHLHSQLLLNIMCDLCEIVLNLDIRKYNFDNIPEPFRSKICQSLGKLTKLEILELNHLSRRIDFNIQDTVRNAVVNLNNLSSVLFTHDCNDEVIKAISENCPKLLNLNVSNSIRVTNDSIPYLIQCPNLRKVDLTYTCVSSSGMAELLIGNPKLINVRLHLLQVVFEEFAAKTSEKLNLVDVFLSHDIVNTEDLKLMVDLCPKLKIFTAEKNSIDDYSVLSNLGHLTELTVSRGNFYSDGIEDLLRKIGRQITTLGLVELDDVNMEALLSVGVNCPNLRRLSIKRCFEGNRQGSFVSRSLKEEIFKNVSYLYLGEETNGNQIQFLLSNCKNIETLHLNGIYDEIDKLLEDVWYAKNPMEKLEFLTVDDMDYLSREALGYLKTNCKNLFNIDIENIE